MWRRILPVLFLALASALSACGLAQPICSGGARLVGGSCFCPLGTTWDGASCQGAPQAGNCGGGAMEVQGMCFCPDGTAWTDPNNPVQCVALNCAGGSVVSANSCVCPEGTSWIDEQCQVPVQTAQCLGGSVPVGSGCECPYGTGWDGTSCVAVAVQDPSQPVAPAPEPSPEPPPAGPVSGEYCYDHECNGQKTGRQCFSSRQEYCQSLCASSNCAAQLACASECRQ